MTRAKKKPPEDISEECERVLTGKRSECYVLRLYIAGNTLRSQTAVENVRKICDEYLKGRYDLEIIDIYQERTKNPADLVLAAPTLIKELPPPLRRITGDMTNNKQILESLDLIQRL